MLPPCDVPVIALSNEYYEVWLINPSVREKILNFIDRYHRQQPSPEATTRLPDASDGADDTDDTDDTDDSDDSDDSAAGPTSSAGGAAADATPPHKALR